MKFICLSMIRFYQLHLRQLHNRRCIYTPSCSHYAMQSIEKYGVIKGIYAFRAALDLSYDTRRRTITVLDDYGKPVIDEVSNKPKKKSQPYQIWTQGFRINFKEGDVLKSNKGFPMLQVKSSIAMDWDTETDSMFEGIVNYQYFDDVKFGSVENMKTVTQMQFLDILLHGIKHP